MGLWDMRKQDIQKMLTCKLWITASQQHRNEIENKNKYKIKTLKSKQNQKFITKRSKKQVQ